MKLQDFGTLFLKSEDGRVLMVFYVKTNFMATHKLLKKHKLMRLGLDKGGKVVNKDVPHAMDKVWGVIVDNGLDYVMDEDMTYTAFSDMIGDAVEVYDYKDYDASKLYAKMNRSGLKKMYTKKWFENAYTYIHNKNERLLSTR